VLFGSDYWKELLDWMRHELLAGGMIAPDDVALLHVTDDPADTVEVVLERYAHRGAEAVDA
jgi:predicted Rossmann-fold nucleotide-binding protein